MKGSARHDVWTVTKPGAMDSNSPRNAGGPFPRLRTEGPTVIVANNDDGHYWQGFESWAELRAFIRDLEKAGQEAFGIEQPK